MLAARLLLITEGIMTLQLPNIGNLLVAPLYTPDFSTPVLFQRSRIVFSRAEACAEAGCKTGVRNGAL